MLHGLHDGGEVVVEQNHVGGFLRHLRTADAHGDADIGVFQGWRVIHAIAGHGHELVPGLQRADDTQLLGGVDPGVDAHLFDDCRKRRLVELGQLRAGQHQFPINRQDAQLLGNGLGGQLVVAGNHHRNNACGLALGHGLLGFVTGWVYKAGQADKGQARFDSAGVDGGGHFGQQLTSVAQHPIALLGHGLDALLQVGHIAFLTVFKLVNKHIYRAFGEAQHALAGLMQRGHALTLRIERQFGDARKPGFKGRPFVRFIGGVPRQRHLGRVAKPLAVGAEGGVGIQGHAGQQGIALLQNGQTERRRLVHVLHGHLIQCQGTGFIGADVGDRPQRFHRRQLANEGVAFRQAFGPQRQRHGNHRGQGFGNSGHRQRDRHQQEPQQRLTSQPASRKKDQANGERSPRQLLTEHAQSLLQRRSGFFGLQ